MTGILLIDKPAGWSSFYLVKLLRGITKEKKIGHAGTLDPFATGLLVMLVGKKYTKMSSEFLTTDKNYLAKLRLGISTDSYDVDGNITNTSDIKPSDEEINNIVDQFQGKILQKPPMFSAKKVNGKKLYDLARKGIEIERKEVEVTVNTKKISYEYPYLNLEISCSKGTYIRSIAHDMGELLGCYAHLETLTRTRVGDFSLSQAIDGNKLKEKDFDINDFFIKL